MYIYNGKQIYPNRSWVDDKGVKHPKNWQIWSDSEKEVMGIVSTPDPELPQSSLEECKKAAIDTIKSQANDMLSKTDWLITRQAEGRKDAPQDVIDTRNAIRDASDVNEANVLSCTTIEEFDSVVISWPVIATEDPLGV